MLLLYINRLSGAQYVWITQPAWCRVQVLLDGGGKFPFGVVFKAPKHPIIFSRSRSAQSLWKKVVTPTLYTSLLSFFKLAKPFVKNLIERSRNKDWSPGMDKILQGWKSCTTAAIRPPYRLLLCSLPASHLSPIWPLFSSLLPPHPFFFFLSIKNTSEKPSRIYSLRSGCFIPHRNKNT